MTTRIYCATQTKQRSNDSLHLKANKRFFLFHTSLEFLGIEVDVTVHEQIL